MAPVSFSQNIPTSVRNTHEYLVAGVVAEDGGAQDQLALLLLGNIYIYILSDNNISFLSLFENKYETPLKFCLEAFRGSCGFIGSPCSSHSIHACIHTYIRKHCAPFCPYSHHLHLASSVSPAAHLPLQAKGLMYHIINSWPKTLWALSRVKSIKQSGASPRSCDSGCSCDWRSVMFPKWNLLMPLAVGRASVWRHLQ